MFVSEGQWALLLTRLIKLTIWRLILICLIGYCQFVWRLTKVGFDWSWFTHVIRNIACGGYKTKSLLPSAKARTRSANRSTLTWAHVVSTQRKRRLSYRQKEEKRKGRDYACVRQLAAIMTCTVSTYVYIYKIYLFRYHPEVYPIDPQHEIHIYRLDKIHCFFQ